MRDADAELAVETRGGRVGVDALGIPAVISKNAHGFSEPASDIKKATPDDLRPAARTGGTSAMRPPG